MLKGRRILLGVTGGIAAYRACDLARALLRDGASVQVVLTPTAAQFVTPLTFTALTGQTAYASEFPTEEVPTRQPEPRTGAESSLTGASGSAALRGGEMAGTEAHPTGEDVYAHLDLTRGIDCFVIAPTSADTLGKLAGGIADNLLTTCYLSCSAPVVIAPAMNVRMWEHPAVQANVAALQARGHVVVEPGSGELACGDVGAGRLADVEDIAAAVRGAVGLEVGRTPSSVSTGELGGDRMTDEGVHPTGMTGTETCPTGTTGTEACPTKVSLSGKRVIVTAGGTREYLDPVRFITNNSSGALGVVVVAAVLERGAAVTLIDTGIELPAELAGRLERRIEATTAFDLQAALTRALPDSDALVMLAAVADYGPTRYSPTKRKKDGAAWALELAETPDVLASLAPLREGRTFIGVSLEDTDWLARGQAKASAKGCAAMLAVELGAELPYGERRMHCALVTPTAVLAAPDMRTKAAAAELVAEWLAGELSG